VEHREAGRPVRTGLLAVALCFSASAALAAPDLDGLQGRRRVVLIASSRLDDPQAMQQRRTLEGWSRGAADRDVWPVDVSGSRVIGCADQASDLRRRFHLSPDAFAVLLIGKDGHVALRSKRPVTAAQLQTTIDAMLMRRAGER
jgi:hypothetical protein